MVRFKNRYLLTEWRWHDGRVDESLTDSVILGILRQCVAVNFGDVGSGAAHSSVAVKYWNATTGLGVVRCGRDVHREVWCGMTLLRDVKGRSVTVRGAPQRRHAEELAGGGAASQPGGVREDGEEGRGARGGREEGKLRGGSGDRLAPAVSVSSSSSSPRANPST